MGRFSKILKEEISASSFKDDIESFFEYDEFIDWYEDGDGWIQSGDKPDFSVNVKDVGSNFQVEIVASASSMSDLEIGDHGHHGQIIDGNSPVETTMNFTVKKSDVPQELDFDSFVELADKKFTHIKTTVTQRLKDTKYYDRMGGNDNDMDESLNGGHQMDFLVELLAINEDQRTVGVEVQYTSYTSWKSACRKKERDVWFDGNKDIANAFVGPKPYVRGETKSIGEWDGSEGWIMGQKRGISKKKDEKKDVKVADPKDKVEDE
jgi:hypothetical protein